MGVVSPSKTCDLTSHSCNVRRWGQLVMMLCVCHQENNKTQHFGISLRAVF